MSGLVTCRLGAASLALALLIQTASALGEHKLHREPVNAFKNLFDLFPEAVAVYTSSHDPSLECVTANRTLYQPNKRVVYTWNLNGAPEKAQHVLEYLPGPSQDTVIGIASHDTENPLHVKFEYSNKKNCVVANFPYKGEDVLPLTPYHNAPPWFHERLRAALHEATATRSECPISILCMLWVRIDAVPDVPQECIDQYEDICSDEVPTYREDQCKKFLDAN